jgi:Flp pilus assembly protein TadD
LPAGSETVGSPQDRFLELYFLLKDGERLERKGEFPEAFQRYRTVREGLRRLRQDYPDWEPSIVSYRLDFVNERLRRLEEIVAAASDLGSRTTGRSVEGAYRPARAQGAPQSEELEVLRRRVKSLEKELAAQRAELANKKAKAAGAAPSQSERALDEGLASATPAEGQSSRGSGALLRKRIEGREESPTVLLERELASKNRQIAELKKRLSILEAQALARSAEKTIEEPAPTKPSASAQQETPPSTWTERIRRATLALEEPDSEYVTHRILLLEEKGAALFYEGRLNEAEACYRKILAEFPDEAKAYGNLASVHLLQGKVGIAEKELLQALRLRPGDPAVTRNLAQLYASGGQYKKARALLGDLLERNPEDLSARMLLAEVYLRSGQYALAGKEARRMLALNPSDTDARTLFALAQLREREETEAPAPTPSGNSVSRTPRHGHVSLSPAKPREARNREGSVGKLRKKSSRAKEPAAPKSSDQSTPLHRQSLPDKQP